MPTKLTASVYAVDLCTYLPDIKTIVISDLHIGFEESLGKQGVLVPRTQYKQIIKRLDWITSNVKVEKVILNGDVKHEFGTISQQEWREVLRLIEYFEKKNIEILIVKGNHDTIIGPIARKKQLKEVKEYRHKDILITHGDYVPDKLAPIIIMGHEHPAITLREKSKAEKFKCFIKGKYKKSVLIVQPSFNPLTQGTDVTKEEVLSPLLSDLSKFEVYIVNDKTHEVLPFGKLKNL
ncbi:MAG TPA: metallophosphoesterase [Candidatus Nanoarchaeia archaeon]|nr:metallophosphoesterase [Candidatus Nanoarchaeia archaeon]